MNSIADRLKHIHERINSACVLAKRNTDTVELLAVSKLQPSSMVEEAFQAGQVSFGENYLQEGIEKIDALKHHREKIQWHLIGPLQSNKTKLAAEYFDWVQSIDRLKIAQRLSEQRPKNLKELNVCVQVNISHEESKSGVLADDALDLCDQISKLPGLKLRGLMTIPAPSSGPAIYQAMNDLFAKIKAHLNTQGLGGDFDTLSLGMSDDLELAIEYGSTMVRIGTAIFGARTA
jgi:pyridoxal phosphate enzyme (YggS family)